MLTHHTIMVTAISKQICFLLKLHPDSPSPQGIQSNSPKQMPKLVYPMLQFLVSSSGLFFVQLHLIWQQLHKSPLAMDQSVNKSSELNPNATEILRQEKSVSWVAVYAVDV